MDYYVDPNTWLRTCRTNGILRDTSAMDHRVLKRYLPPVRSGWKRDNVTTELTNRGKELRFTVTDVEQWHTDG